MNTPSPLSPDQPTSPAGPAARLQRSSCPICTKPQGRSIAAPDPWKLSWCEECGLVYMTNPPAYEAMTVEFEWEQSYYAEKKRRHEAHGRVGGRIATAIAGARLRYRKLTKRNKLLELGIDSGLSGDVIDVGCGDGHLWPSLPTGCVPIGIELSPALAQQARQRLGTGPGKLIEADALGGLQQLPSESVNGAIAISFLEHEVRPMEVLHELRRVLRRGGAAIIKVPNYACWNRIVRGPRWCGYRFPDHVNYFTPRALRKTVEKSGFTVARFGWKDRLPTSDNMWCVARSLCASVSSALTGFCELVPALT